MHIIADTREQKPIFTLQTAEVRKLEVGDYTTKELEGIYHIDRKSGIDLYGSIIQGHERFKRMFLRAKELGTRVDVFVECSQAMFIGKRFEGGWRLKQHPKVLAAILKTMSAKYDFEIVWCDGREDMEQRILERFEQKTRDLSTN